MSPLSMAGSATPAAAPHVPSKASVSRTMFLVQASLVPATLYGF